MQDRQQDPPGRAAPGPIGVFDSGLGGLTVVRAIHEVLPCEQLVYLGDTARVPYGTRSPETVVHYARNCANHLLSHDIKVLVVACNTVSAVAMRALRSELEIPVLGVVQPGASAGLAARDRGAIGVLATQGTVSSGAYPAAVGALAEGVPVVACPAPLLVPLAEEGWTQGQVPELVVDRYLADLDMAARARRLVLDAVVLGCTHYPLFESMIQRRAATLFDPVPTVVDSAAATARALASQLERLGLVSGHGGAGGLELCVTDKPESFREVAGRFLGRPVEAREVVAVDLAPVGSLRPGD